jgi:CBS domain-containing protein
MVSLSREAPPLSLAASRVADAMTTGLISCTPDTPLRDVGGIMAEEHIHAVYVFDYDTETAVERWGLVSDLDLVAATGGDIDQRSAGDSAVTPLVTVRSDDSLARAAQLMNEYNVAHLAVLDPATRRPIGVLSTLDLARVVAEEDVVRTSDGSDLYGSPGPAD